MGTDGGNTEGATDAGNETTTITETPKDNMEEKIVDNNTAGEATNIPTEEAGDTPRSKFRNRFKDSHPDLDTENQDDFYNAADEQFSSLNDYKTRNDSVNKQMIDTFNSNPELAGMMKDIMKGAPLNVAIARNMDIDSLAPQEGDPDEGAWKEGLTARQKSRDDSDAYTKSISDNMEVSAKEVQAFAQENSLDGEATANFLSEVDNLVSDAIKGTVTKQTLSNLYRAMNADSEVAAAAEVAEVKGRNENIEAKKVEVAPEGDGLPKVTSTTEEKEPPPKEKLDPFSEAIAYQENKKRI